MGKRLKSNARKSAINKLVKKTDNRIKEEQRVIRTPKEDEQALKLVHAPKISSAMFMKYNTQLGPPFHVIVDTNFVNFAVKNRIDMFQGLMDCLYAKTIVYATDCVLAELEKVRKFKIALKVLKDPRVKRLKCEHKGTYADDCLVQRVTQHKCYIVATCDRDLKRRIRKIPGVPIMYIVNHRFSIERMPDAYGAPMN